MNRILSFIAAASAAMLASAATSQTQAAPAPVYAIGLYSYGYAPSPIRLTAGRPVTLAFVNRSGKGHDFTAEKFFRASRILAGTVEDGEVGLKPGQSKSVTLVPAAGTYPVHCSHFFHDQLGMHTTIIVQ